MPHRRYDEDRGIRSDLAVVCWNYGDGKQGRGSPLARGAAERLAEEYRRRYTERTFVVRTAEVATSAETAGMGREAQPLGSDQGR